MRPDIRFSTGLVLCLLFYSSAVTADDGLRGQIERLSRDQGFEIRGLERLDTATTTVPSKATANRLRLLLRKYDYVLEHRPGGAIKRLIVLGVKRPAPAVPDPADEIVLPTQRRGEHHLVNAILEGPAGEKLAVRMMVDTGASLIVIPVSIGKFLGLDGSKLESKELQTASGKIHAPIAKLKTLRLGSLTLDGVETALVADEDLGGTALLGMNVLSRYLFVLDDEQNQLVLIPDTGKEP